MSPDTSVALPGTAWVVALAGLPGMGPARLAALLDRWPPDEAWRRVVEGRAQRDPVVAEAARGIDDVTATRWQAAARDVEVAAAWAGQAEAGVAVVARGEAGFPPALAADPEPPAVVFHLGSLEALKRPRVAVVGTRRCTNAGRSVATELGADLAAAGVCVVSGLALGIDGAAHEGALQARGGAAPVGVVGTGLDVVYPRRHANLWAAVAAAGALLSEYPRGTRPERWRFPARNRLIAALADVVVVVESHAAGGSMHTVESALERGRVVMAVPGPVRSPASAGTNGLLAAGSPPARDADDVLVALGLDSEANGRGLDSEANGRGLRRSGQGPAPPSGERGAVLEAVGWEPAALDQVAGRSGLSLAAVAVHLAHLQCEGWLVSTGGWFERNVTP